MYLVLLKKTPFLTAPDLASLLVIPSLDGISHRRHSGRWFYSLLFLLLVRLMINKVYESGNKIKRRKRREKVVVKPPKQCCKKEKNGLQIKKVLRLGLSGEELHLTL